MRVVGLIPAIVIGVTTSLAGCGSDSDSAADAVSQDQVDPRYATASALVEEFNRLNTRMPPDLANLLPLYHIETEFQRKKLQVLQREAASAWYEFDVALYDRFGEGFLDFRRNKPRPCTPATITKHGEQRTEGVYADRFGKERPLHLINTGTRWWISGYTLEYETDTDKRDLVEGMTDAMLTWEGDDSYLQPIVIRTKAGEFTSIKQARDAANEAMRNYLEQKYGDLPD